VYTGYLKLFKQARVLRVNPNNSNLWDEIKGWTADASQLRVALPGDRIEYQINYENISDEVVNATGNIPLNANNLTITEDGEASPNNWGNTTNHVPGQVTTVGNPATLTLSPGNNDNDPTTKKYVYKVNTGSLISPKGTGSFKFMRVVK
jgi:hypothetical protein